MKRFKAPKFFVLGCLAAAELSASPPEVRKEQQRLLTNWFEALGAPGDEETYGQYVARAARLQHGVGYTNAIQPPTEGEEPLDVRLDRFECVTFIESSLAVARCGWQGQRSTGCFVRELAASRYRDGERRGYGSRLHYFSDWIDDNEKRHRLSNLTEAFGGQPVRKQFDYISTRTLARAALAEDTREQLREEMRGTEARLTAADHAVLLREEAPAALAELQEGDLVAFVREREGMLVHHAGFIIRSPSSGSNENRLLHASSYHQRVVITVRDVTNYLLRRPERRGVILARPLPP